MSALSASLPAPEKVSEIQIEREHGDAPRRDRDDVREPLRLDAANLEDSASEPMLLAGALHAMRVVLNHGV